MYWSELWIEGSCWGPPLTPGPEFGDPCSRVSLGILFLEMTGVELGMILYL